jgi:hypothetical protein
MIMKNKIKVFVVLTCFILIFLSGCSESKQESTAATKAATKKGNDILSYLGKSATDITKSFGKPNKIDGAENGDIYNYDNFYFAISNNKVVTIGVKGADTTVNGIKIGMKPKDVKSKIGNPLKETNSNGFVMEYRLNNNSVSVQYCCDDFTSPVSSITVSDLTFGKEKPMEVSKEKVESMIEGNWVLEKDINQENLSQYIHTFKNGVQDEKLGIWKSEYHATSSNTILFHNLVADGFGGTKEVDTEYHIEFYDNGDKMEIYVLDKYGDKDTSLDQVYCRYN